MKFRVRRITALMLAASLLAAGSNVDFTVPPVHAEEAVDASAETPGETQPQTTAPAEEPQPETPAPQPDPPAPEPETQAPQPETPAPQSETPVPELETPAPQPESAATEAQTSPETTAQTTAETTQSETTAPETQSESAQETEAVVKTDTFSKQVGSATVKIILPKGQEVTDKAVFDISVKKLKEDEANRRKVKSLLEKGRRTVSGARFYTLHLYNGAEEIQIPKGTKVEYSRGDGLSLNAAEYQQAAYQVLNISGETASEISADLNLSGDRLSLTKAVFTAGSGLSAFAFVCTQNRVNDGAEKKQKDLREDLKKTAAYTILADTYQGDAEEGVRTTAMDADAEYASEKKAGELLKDLSGYTLQLGNVRGSGDLAVVNLYTDENGIVLTDASDPQDPLKAVETEDNRIDVTDRTVVVNIIAVNTPDKTVELPAAGICVKKDGRVQAVSDTENTELAGRVLYNVVALAEGTEGTWRLAPYTGKLAVSADAVGNYYAPEAEITFGKNLTGGIYAKKAATGKKVVSSTVTAELPKETEAPTEAVTEAPAEVQTEAAADDSAELLKAAEEEEETETEAETETELETEAETETETETESEEEQLLHAADGETGFKGGAASGTVTVKKVDAEGNPVSGAELVLYNTVELKDTDDSVTPANTALYTWASGDGSEDISGWILPDGKYVIRETKTPEGYAKAWDQEYNPETETVSDPDPVETKVKATEIAVEDKKVDESAPEEYPSIAVKDSGDNSCLPGITLSIEKKVTETVEDGAEQEISNKTVVFDSELDYVVIDLSKFCADAVAPYLDTEGKTVTTKVLLTVKETLRKPGYIFDGKQETTLTIAWDETAKKPKIDYSAAQTDAIAEQDGDTWKLTFKQKKPVFTVAAYKVNTTTTVPGAVFELKDPDGKLLTAGTDYTVSGAAASGSKVTITNAPAVITLINDKLIETLLKDTKKTLSVNWVTIPEGHYVAAKSSKTGSLSLSSPSTKIELGDQSTIGTITVTRKSRYLDDNKTRNPASEARTYYFTLFDGAGAVIEIKKLTVSAFNFRTSSSVSFDDLAPGKYYLKETDAKGGALSESNLKRIIYNYDSQGLKTQMDKDKKTDKAIPVEINKVETGNAEMVRDTHTVQFYNIYSQKDTATAAFTVKVRVVDANNQETPVTLTAKYTIRWTAGGKNWKVNPQPSLTLNNTSSATSKLYSIPFPSDENVKAKVRLVSLTDENGNSVAGQYMLVDNATFARLTSAQKTISLIDGMKNGEVLFTLKKVQKATKDVAQLTLTKAVTYQKVPMRVNATYYLGIFTDAAHTKLLFKKALPLSNASSRSSTLKINLYKLKNANHSITLYFAETDSKGRVVSDGTKVGYNISLNKTSVTLSPENAEETIILTNDIIRGSKTARRLTDPTSGFAGDRTALAEAQALANSNSTTGKKTGDSSPIGPLALAALVSAGIIVLLLAALLIRRRRRR